MSEEEIEEKGSQSSKEDVDEERQRLKDMGLDNFSKQSFAHLSKKDEEEDKPRRKPQFF